MYFYLNDVTIYRSNIVLHVWTFVWILERCWKPRPKDKLSNISLETRPLLQWKIVFDSYYCIILTIMRQYLGSVFDPTYQAMISYHEFCQTFSSSSQVKTCSSQVKYCSLNFSLQCRMLILQFSNLYNSCIQVFYQIQQLPTDGVLSWNMHTKKLQSWSSSAHESPS